MSVSFEGKKNQVEGLDSLAEFLPQFSLSALALKKKSIWRRLGQNEKQNENEEKRKSITTAMLFFLL